MSFTIQYWSANISAERKHIKLQVQCLQTAQCKTNELIQRELNMFYKEYLHLYVVDRGLVWRSG